MAKRPAIDLSAITAETAEPMREASQRSAQPALEQAGKITQRTVRTITTGKGERVPTTELVQLAFKVPPDFRRRFEDAAHDRRIKLNELLFQSLDAWEKQNKL